MATPHFRFLNSNCPTAKTKKRSDNRVFPLPQLDVFLMKFFGFQFLLIVNGSGNCEVEAFHPKTWNRDGGEKKLEKKNELKMEGH
jgi:hypothetical protein